MGWGTELFATEISMDLGISKGVDSARLVRDYLMDERARQAETNVIKLHTLESRTLIIGRVKGVGNFGKVVPGRSS